MSVQNSISRVCKVLSLQIPPQFQNDQPGHQMQISERASKQPAHSPFQSISVHFSPFLSISVHFCPAELPVPPHLLAPIFTSLFCCPFCPAESPTCSADGYYSMKCHAGPIPQDLPWCSTRPLPFGMETNRLWAIGAHWVSGSTTSAAQKPHCGVSWVFQAGSYFGNEYTGVS